MSYFDGNEFFFFLAIALVIGFIINYLGKRIEYYILALSIIFAAFIYGKNATMLSYLVGFIIYEYVLVEIAQKTENKKIRQGATVPSYEDGKVKALTSFVVYNEEIEKRFEVTKQIKQELKKLVPEYMIPKKIVFIEEMPLNNNGKIDKKKLKELV